MRTALPTHELAFAGYPQREADLAWQGLREAARWLQAAWPQGSAAARLPADIARGMANGQARLPRATEASMQRVLPDLRARLRACGLKGEVAGWALAYVAEVAKRRIGLEPYPSQLLAAWLMLDGRLAEMATGEGKTLAAGIAAATAALSGVPVHLFTANDYLVQRDREKLEPLYAALGLSSACVLPAMCRTQRAAAYRCEIVVTTARELAFDYLRDHLLLSGVRDPRLLRALDIVNEDMLAEAAAEPATQGNPESGATKPAAGPVLPGLCFALIDEADSILLDEATVPLILAAPADEIELQSCRYALAIASTLRRQRDYELRPAQRRCELSDEGRDAVTAAAQAIDGDPGWLRPARRAHELVAAALTARHALRAGRDYVVADGKLQLIDEITGRIADGRQWTGVLQTMVELEAGLAPGPATRVAAQITYQNLFARYLRLGGMSGTLLEARREVRMSYGSACRRVPLLRPDRRRQLGCRLHADTARRDAGLLRSVQRMLQLGRPVLVGTDSVGASQHVAALLRAAGIECQLLNAVQDRHEADCVARAGQSGVVTVATNMAGRGTDIVLDDAARAAGGLHVIATMCNRARRIDRQLAGRAARHGDPGSVEMLLALDDALFTDHAPAAVRQVLAFAARQGVVPGALAAPFIAAVQRSAEWQARAARAQLRRSERAADETFAFAGGTE